MQQRHRQVHHQGEHHEDGPQGSGGELARLALARVLMRPHQLLILDEPTAAMDMEATALAEGSREKPGISSTVRRR